MKFKLTDATKSEQARGERARFIVCKKCHNDEFEDTGILFKSVICTRCGHRFNKEEGAIYKRIELEGGKSSRKIRPGAGARFKKSEIDFGRRK